MPGRRRDSKSSKVYSTRLDSELARWAEAFITDNDMTTSEFVHLAVARMRERDEATRQRYFDIVPEARCAT